MTFPFGDNPPPKDINKVKYNIVDIYNSEEKKKLFDFLLSKGYKLLADSMYEDEGFYLVGVPINKLNSIGYFGVMSAAEQVYHGAKHYQCVIEFIKEEF